MIQVDVQSKINENLLSKAKKGLKVIKDNS